MPNAAPAVVSEDSFAALFEESLTRKEMRTGEVITAEVVRVDMNYVVVNAGLKSESFIAIEEFKNDKGEVEVKPGDFTSVAIEALVDIRPVKDTLPYEGKEMEFKVIKLDRKRNNVVVSRRAVLEASQGAEHQ